MPEDEAAKRRKAEEAARIIRILEEDPKNIQALKDRDEFLGRGEVERRVYNNLLRAFGMAQKGLKNRDRSYLFILIGAFLASLYLAWSPVQTLLASDFRTQATPKTVSLESGDRVTLDASSAITDDTHDGTRLVKLLAGAGYFDVDQNEQPFVVVADDVRIEVVGTSFEVLRLSESIIVRVEEGAVKVEHQAYTDTLYPGDQLHLSISKATRSSLDLNLVGEWRRDFLTMDGLAFAEVASVIDRRLPGSIMVVGEALQSQQVVGGLDLKQPLSALQTLAATSGAAVVSIPGVLTIVYQP